MANDATNNRRSLRQRIPNYESAKTLVKGPGQSHVTLLGLSEMITEDYSIRVLITTDGLKAYIDATLPENGKITFSDLQLSLDKARITQGIDKDALNYILVMIEKATPQKPLGLIEVAKGQPPQHGQDAWIDYLVLPSRQKANYATNEQGNVDYRQLNTFQNVRKGQRVALLHPATEGVAGIDLFGDEIPCKQGNNCRARAGEMVSLQDNYFVAEENGRLVVDHDVLSICTVYEIFGDVDMSVGHVNFIGDVIVHGSVLNEFSVSSGKALTIHGTAGNCRLEGRESVTLTGGMIGKKGQAHIISDGSVTAKFLGDVLVEAGGKVTVQNELMNCIIYASDSVTVLEGPIIGGEIVALGRITADEIGSSMGVLTKVTAGVDWRSRNELEEISKQLTETQKILSEASRTLAPLLRQKSIIPTLSPERKLLMRELINYIRGFHRQIGDLEKRRQAAIEIREKKHSVVNGRIDVLKRLHAETLIGLGGQMQRINKTATGPLSVEAENDKIRILPAFSDAGYGLWQNRTRKPLNKN